MSVKIVKFNCHGCFAPAYGCSLPGDNSGDYVLHSDYSAIEEERDKLAQEVMRLVNMNEQLHERLAAIVEAVHKAMDRTADCDKKQTDDQLIADVAYLKRLASDYFKTSHEWRCLAFAAKQKYNALVEAVAWERECCQDIRPLVAWADLYVRHGEDYVDGVAEDLRAIQDAASSEVDRLIASETAAECEGEG